MNRHTYEKFNTRHHTFPVCQKKKKLLNSPHLFVAYLSTEPDLA